MGVPLAAIGSLAAAPFTGGLSLAGLGAVAGLAGAGIAGIGALDASDARAKTATYQAQVAENNRQIAARNAEMEITSGEISAANRGLQTRAAVGTQKTVQGAGGIEVGTGSAADVRKGTQQMGLLDAITIRSNAARRAYGYQVTESNQEAQKRLLETQASQEKIAGPMAAAGTLLSGASTVGSNWAKWQNVAPTGGIA